MLVKAANRQPGTVRIGRPGQEQVDAKSILSVLSLAVTCGEQVMVQTEGPSADEALTELLAMLAVDPDV
jgi:phosphocarrier protein